MYQLSTYLYLYEIESDNLYFKPISYLKLESYGAGAGILSQLVQNIVFQYPVEPHIVIIAQLQGSISHIYAIPGAVFYIKKKSAKARIRTRDLQCRTKRCLKLFFDKLMTERSKISVLHFFRFLQIIFIHFFMII